MSPAVACPPPAPGPEVRLGQGRREGRLAFWCGGFKSDRVSGGGSMRRPDLRSQLDAVPRAPGVYEFLGDADEILYVGKAVDLRSRVRSYFHEGARHAPKVNRLVERVARLDWIVTASELEALLLEMTLIKAHRPRYNVTLKDDKRYPYIKVHAGSVFPRVEATRSVVRDGARYYGPYTSAASLYDTMDTLRKVFPYLTCHRTITGTDPRSCLYDDIGLCAAPCVGKVGPEEYRAIIQGLEGFLKGRTRDVIRGLEAQMAEHSHRLEYEEAGRTRDRIEAIKRVIGRQRIIAPGLADQDVIAVARDEGSAVAQVFFVRDGKLIGREHFQLSGAEDEPVEEVLASFIKHFYEGSGHVPGEILVPDDVAESRIISAWLREKRGTRVKITVPRRGHKRDLIDVAVENAAQTLRALAFRHASETEGGETAVAALQRALDLPRPPRRLEGYDISTLQGASTVGSMVVFVGAVPTRADYRRFKVREAPPGDDFASLREVLGRRFRRLAAHRASVGGDPASAFEATPDLVIIDGGRGQLGVAERVLSSLGLDDVPVASVAKRREELFRPGRPDPIRLPADSPALHLVQHLRDEAHRFAVTYHRRLRRRRGLTSTLEEIPGIGVKRRQALMRAFGSLEAIRRASIEELAAVPSMTKSAAEQIKAYL